MFKRIHVDSGAYHVATPFLVVQFTNGVEVCCETKAVTVFMRAELAQSHRVKSIQGVINRRGLPLYSAESLIREARGLNAA